MDPPPGNQTFAHLSEPSWANGVGPMSPVDIERIRLVSTSLGACCVHSGDWDILGGVGDVGVSDGETESESVPFFLVHGACMVAFGHQAVDGKTLSIRDLQVCLPRVCFFPSTEALDHLGSLHSNWEDPRGLCTA